MHLRECSNKKAKTRFERGKKPSLKSRWQDAYKIGDFSSS